MIRSIDTLSTLARYDLDRKFDLERWKEYIDAWIPGISTNIIDDVRIYDFKNDVLPIIKEAIDKNDRFKDISSSFQNVTFDLDQKFLSLFSKTLDVTIVLYLGLCNGAGWALDHQGDHMVLLGTEKILELSWDDDEHLKALIYHELGHIYQDTYGAKIDKEFDMIEDKFYWLLYTEGIAMYIEQALIGDLDYFHQDHAGYKEYLDGHLKELTDDFISDAKVGSDRYFGDWRDYHGHGDAGYLLGARFIKELAQDLSFDKLIDLDVGEVKEYFKSFASKM